VPFLEACFNKYPKYKEYVGLEGNFCEPLRAISCVSGGGLDEIVIPSLQSLVVANNCKQVLSIHLRFVKVGFISLK
jgi:hypothetical protein